MPKYVVKDTHIRRGDRTYAPGSTIELSEEEAAPMLHHLESIEAREEPPAPQTRQAGRK